MLTCQIFFPGQPPVFSFNHFTKFAGTAFNFPRFDHPVFLVVFFWPNLILVKLTLIF